MRSIDGAAALAETSQAAMLKLVSASYRQQLQRSLMDFVFLRQPDPLGAPCSSCATSSARSSSADLVLRGIYGVGELSGLPSRCRWRNTKSSSPCARAGGVPDQHWSPMQRMMLAVGYI